MGYSKRETESWGQIIIDCRARKMWESESFFSFFAKRNGNSSSPFLLPSPLLSLAGALKLQASYEKKRGERGATWIFIGAGWAEKQQQRRQRNGRLIGDTEEEEETDEIAAAPDFP